MDKEENKKMEDKQVLDVFRVLKTSSKGTQYETIVITILVNGKQYELGQIFLDDTKIALLDIAKVPYAEAK